MAFALVQTGQMGTSPSPLATRLAFLDGASQIDAEHILPVGRALGTGEQRTARNQLREVEEQVTSHIRRAISHLQELYQAGVM